MWLVGRFNQGKDQSFFPFSFNLLHPHKSSSAMSSSSSLKTKAEMSIEKRKKFESIFPVLVEELTQHLTSEGMPKDAIAWYKNNLEHNTPGGKLNRGLSVVDTVEILSGKGLEENDYTKAAILGWCVELLQAYFLVADDMMDQSLTRRGQPCWYKFPHVGNIAINDAFMLEAAIYFLLKKHFRSHQSYGLLLELFHDVTFQTEMGQLIDLITAPEDSVDLNRFSLQKHHLIVVYKTAFYSFYLPVALAMRLVGITDESLYKTALDILLPLGEYFQVQDDYLDCYGSPETIGKIGTDILDNKCSWLINSAIEICSPQQRQILDDNYGRKNKESEQKVKEVFLELKLEERFKKYEQESYEKIIKLIEGVDESKGLKKEVFISFLEKVYKRTK